jgi:hypothetical protein
MNVILSQPSIAKTYTFHNGEMDVFHSICNVDNVDYTVCRHVNQFNWASTHIKFEPDTIIGGGEDPRAFLFNGQLAYCCTVHTPSTGHMPHVFVKNDNQWTGTHYKMTDSKNPGKNWAPFVYNKELYFVQEISPFRVLKANGDKADTFFVQDIDAPKQHIDGYSILRGGCNGLQISDNKVMGFGHSNHAPGDWDSIVHLPFVWLIDMTTKSVEIFNVDFGWDNNYKIVDPTSFFIKDGQYYLTTCESNMTWIYNVTQQGRSCIYPVSFSL